MIDYWLKFIVFIYIGIELNLNFVFNWLVIYVIDRSILFVDNLNLKVI